MKKILVANRGEIALRIIRAVKELGIATVAVYSRADRKAAHVAAADEAVCIGAPPSRESYLNISAILEACKVTGADGVHPGYGFLSENSEFAAAVVAAGIIFIGPPASVIELMGSKLAAKSVASKQGLPLVPGSDGPVGDFRSAQSQAEKIGFPLLIKASAGGGGKGMRIVAHPEELEDQLQMAKGEAQSAFGDDRVFFERYITSPRHIEIQILADSHGNVVHLFERECSIQRRHQKIIEEAPSVLLDEDVRQQMGLAAVALAQACGYTNAGTVEFIVDEHKNFFFLEVNTRLQVEHPVTEQITGIDLVKEQIHIASGGKLRYRQEEIMRRGHAIELRVYAETPEEGFLPNTGTLAEYILPEGPGVRVDNAAKSGMEVTYYYDPMLAKLIAYGPDRQSAIETMKRAIEEYYVAGIRTTLSFGLFVMNHPAFVSGNFDTGFVEKYFLSKEGGLKNQPGISNSSDTGDTADTGETAEEQIKLGAKIAFELLSEEDQQVTTAGYTRRLAHKSGWVSRRNY